MSVNERLEWLNECLGHLEQAQDDLNGVEGVMSLKYAIEDVISELNEEIEDADKAAQQEDAEEEAAEMREYYRAVI